MKASNVWDLNSKTANFCGFEPCPECGSTGRYSFIADPDRIVCTDCFYSEEKADINWAEWKRKRGI